MICRFDTAARIRGVEIVPVGVVNAEISENLREGISSWRRLISLDEPQMLLGDRSRSARQCIMNSVGCQVSRTGARDLESGTVFVGDYAADVQNPTRSKIAVEFFCADGVQCHQFDIIWVLYEHTLLPSRRMRIWVQYERCYHLSIKTCSIPTSRGWSGITI